MQIEDPEVAKSTLPNNIQIQASVKTDKHPTKNNINIKKKNHQKLKKPLHTPKNKKKQSLKYENIDQKITITFLTYRKTTNLKKLNGLFTNFQFSFIQTKISLETLQRPSKVNYPH